MWEKSGGSPFYSINGESDTRRREGMAAGGDRSQYADWKLRVSYLRTTLLHCGSMKGVTVSFRHYLSATLSGTR